MPRKNIGLTAEGKVKPKKADSTENGNINVEVLKNRDKGKVMLRISKNLTILVNPENKNEEYAALYRQKNGMSKI